MVPKRLDAPFVCGQRGGRTGPVAHDSVRADVLGPDPRRGKPRVLREAERERVEGWILADELGGALRYVLVAGRVNLR
jgi:hypothetical protein